MKHKIVDTNLAISQGGRSQSYWLGKKPKTNLSSRTNNTESEIDIVKLLWDYSWGGFEFGNWVTNSERYDRLLATQQSFKDLAAIMKTKNLGIDCHLSLAYGARGKTSANAHYEPSNEIINLTKESGTGALAHEYGHALDYIIGMYFDQHKDYHNLVGKGISTSLPGNVGGQFRKLANQIVDSVMETTSFKKFKDSLSILDEKRYYWCSRTEVWARTFEQYIGKKLYDNKMGNTFLAKSYPGVYVLNGKYPQYLKHLDFVEIEPLMDKFIKEVALLLNDKCKLVTTPYWSTSANKIAATKPKSKTTTKAKTKPKTAPVQTSLFSKNKATKRK